MNFIDNLEIYKFKFIYIIYKFKKKINFLYNIEILFKVNQIQIQLFFTFINKYFKK